MPILLAALALAACGTSITTNPQTSGPSLYTRPGGKPPLTAVVDEFVSRVAADTRINSFFAGMGITHAHFVALVEDLAAALDKFNVPTAQKNELLGALAPLEPMIVTAS